jgi:hypothetical protein
VVALIGYVILVPSVLGIISGIMIVVGSLGAGGAMPEAADDEFRTALTDAQFPPELLEDAVANELSKADKDSLTVPQRSALDSAETGRAAFQLGAGAGAAIGFGLGIAIVIGSFVGGLLGWLLILKKKILQCGSCQATVAAS